MDFKIGGSWGRLTLQFQQGQKGTSGQVRGTACSGQTFRQTIDSIRNTFAFVEENVAFREKKIVDHVKLFFTEHNHDADHLANMEEHEQMAKGFKNITVEKNSNIGRWKAVRG